MKSKELKVNKEFIKEAHTAACSEWKTRIKKEFPDVFPEVCKPGMWVKLTQDYSILKKGEVYYALEYQTNSQKYMIVNHSTLLGVGDSDYSAPDVKNMVPATREEIKAALTVLAINNGYKPGMDIAPIDYTSDDYIGNGPSNYQLTYNSEDTYLRLNGAKVFRLNKEFPAGKWADAQCRITLEEAEKMLDKKIIV